MSGKQLEGQKNIEKLWHRYNETRDIDSRNDILVHYLGLVKTIVYRMMPLYHVHNEYDDLLNYGVLGLIDAIDKFDLSQKVKFETYATIRIRGTILDHMRRQDWASSSLRRKISAVSEAYERLEVDLGRYPSNTEVAEHLNMKTDELNSVLEKSHAFNLLYFEDMVTESYSLQDICPSDDDGPADIYSKKEMARLLSELIELLPEKERLVITLYYYEEFTLKEIAAVLKVSESRVSQIHSKVLLEVGNKFKKSI